MHIFLDCGTILSSIDDEFQNCSSLPPFNQKDSETDSSTVTLKPDIHNMRLDVTSLIIVVERSDFVKIMDLKFLKFELNFEMLTWIFPNLGKRF